MTHGAYNPLDFHLLLATSASLRFRFLGRSVRELRSAPGVIISECSGGVYVGEEEKKEQFRRNSNRISQRYAILVILP
ncbi:hypothetical protein NDU88_009747 [Pleurodeles waltl]|uniref:Uncharacterized protein n=1 Tax=Pleurodeles waltl TaxID=8319 RepID=A0AAV7PWP5_PLEWA|nr:hypothetical protein NDU88_009747 [Pleurodeles waltl]